MQRVEITHNVKISELNPASAFAPSSYSTLLQNQIMNGVNNTSTGDITLPISNSPSSLNVPVSTLFMTSQTPFYIRVGSNLDTTTLTTTDAPATVTTAVDAYISTTSTSVLLVTSTTIDAASTAAFPTSGTIMIGTEEIAYTGTTATTFTGLTRGSNATTVASHAINDVISNTGDIAVSNASSYPANGVIWIGTEQIAYTTRTTTLLQGVTRGFNSSTTASHSVGQAVLRTDSITVGSTLGFASSGGSVIIETEEIYYTSKTLTTFNGLTRGYNATIATNHAAANTVTEVNSTSVTTPIMRTSMFMYSNIDSQLNSIQIWNGGLTLAGSTFTTTPSVKEQTISFFSAL